MGIQINGQTDTVTSTTAGGSVKVTPLAASTGLNVGTGASISSPATNVLTLGTNNVERVRIDSSGNTGIGTNNLGAPYKVDVRVNTNDPSTGSPSTGSIFQIRGDDATVGNGPSLVLSNFGGSKETAWRISAVSTSGNNGDLVFNGYAGGATYPEVARFTSAGNLKFPSGQGIDFSATANSSGTMTSELLSDYEEGTWTPTIAGSSTPGTYQASAAVGWYRKIGSVVTGQFRIDLAGTVTGGGTGNFYITGLPFTVSSSPTNAAGWASVAYMYGITISGTYAMFFPAGGGTVLLEVSYDRLGNQYLDSPSIVGANDIVGGGFVYIAA